MSLDAASVMSQDTGGPSCSGRGKPAPLLRADGGRQGGTPVSGAGRLFLLRPAQIVSDSVGPLDWSLGGHIE